MPGSSSAKGSGSTCSVPPPRGGADPLSPVDEEDSISLGPALEQVGLVPPVPADEALGGWREAVVRGSPLAGIRSRIACIANY